MVIYEVNLSICDEIYTEYYAWLLGHIKQILKFDGFKRADVGRVDGTKDVRVCYWVDSLENLNNYLALHAVKMRQEAIERFGDQFTATRRVVVDVESL
jgi:hypothetical protein